MSSKYIGGYGSTSAKLMIVAEAPGEYEEIEGRPLVGPTGQLTQEMTEEAGEKWNNTYRTNVFKYHPPDNDLRRAGETGHTIAECVPQLWEEIKAIKPNAILALGALALETLTGKKNIQKHRGSILESLQGFPKIIPTFHPARLFNRGKDQGAIPYSSRVYMQWDFNRAVQQSQFRDFRRPNRILEIARNSGQLWSYIQKYSDKKRLSVDIEVYKGIPTCVGLAFSPNHAISVPVTDLPLGKNPVCTPPRELCEIIILLSQLLEDPSIQIIGQNYKFDQEKLATALGIHTTDPYADTQILSSALYPELPRNLAFLCSIHTEEPFYKDEYAEFDGRKDSFDRVMLYNAKDVAITYEVYERQIEELRVIGQYEFAMDYLMRLHPFYRAIEHVGFPMDFAARDELYKKYIDEEKRGDAELESLLGRPFNVRSNPNVKAFIENEVGLVSDNGYGEDELVRLLSHKKIKNDPRVIRIFDLIMRQRQIKRMISSNIEFNPDYDDRIRTTYNIVGTETGRSSTGILDPPTRPHKIGQSFHATPKHGVGSDIKRFYKADPGKVIVGCDLSQAEPRIVGHLAKDEWLNGLYKTGKDVHRYTAQLCFNLSDEERDKLPKDGDKRFIGKVVRNAGHYDAGPRRLRDTINSDARKFGLNVTVNQSTTQLLLDTFHRRSPSIRGTYHVEVQAALSEHDRTLINPYGRRRQFLDRWGKELFKQAYAQLPQSTVKDKIAHAGLELVRRIPGLTIVIEWHDAYYFMLDKVVYKEQCAIIKEEMERPIDFSRCSLPRDPLTIPCEFEVGENLYDMEKLVI